MKDLTDLQQLRSHLSQFGLEVNKSLGQHFLIDPSVLEAIITAADVQDTDTVLEVGPGPGVLSQRLAPLVKKMTAVEIDEQMIAPWKTLMSDFPSSEIIHSDVLEFIPEDLPYKLVANIPYYITSPILKHFLRNQEVRKPNKIVLLIQREVAERICSQKKPTLLSWEIRIFGEPQVITAVPPSSFYPAPKVDSAILLIDVFSDSLLPAEMLNNFFSLLSVAYKQPRKTLKNNFSSDPRFPDEKLAQLFQQSQIDGGLRPHQLDLEQWKSLFNAWKGF